MKHNFINLLKIVFVITLLLITTSARTQAAEIGCCSNAPVPQPGWYPNITQFDEVSKYGTIPRPKDVTIIDARPGARKYDKGHIPGAINIPLRQFDKMIDKMPKAKDNLIIYHCGGLKCMLSHKSAFKAEKLGYTNIKVYAQGFPDWKKNGGIVAVTVPHLKKMMDRDTKMVIVDSRPKARKYDKGHIPGAISIPDRSFSSMLDKLPADKATPLYFYCGGMKCKLSPKSAQKAMDLGYTKVYIVPEGYPGWKKAYGGKASIPKIKEGNDSGSISVASFQKILKVAPETLLLVDVRDPDQFKQGTFKGAINLPIDDLEKRMGELVTAQNIVFFCGSGGIAGEAYDILQTFKPELKSYFLNAETTFNSDGSFKLVEL